MIFLLFVIGLEVSWERLWALKRMVFGLGTTQVLVTAAVLTGAALAFGAAFPIAAVIGLTFALSSTALVLQLLRERKQITTPVGRTSFSILLMQDLMVVPILFAVGALGVGFERFGPEQIGFALGSAVAALIVITLVGRLVLRPLFRWVAAIDSREVFIAAAILAAVGMSIAAEQAGLSMALGAFLAGMLLAETEFRHQIETDLEPLKDLLLGLFFVTVGMQINLALFLSNPLVILGGVLALFAIKAALIAPMARAFGVPWPRAGEIAFLLAGVGEFAFIVIASATAGGVIPGGIAEYMLLVTAISLFVTPLSAWAGRALAARFAEANEDAVPIATERRDHVVIAGCGRVGRLLADILDAQEIDHVGVDADPVLISKLRAAGRPFHYGDASRRDVLAAVNASHAAAIVITMDKPEDVERIVREAKAAWPSVPVFARARDAAHARRLRDLGADMASPDTVESALQLSEAVLNGLGVPDEMASHIIAARRTEEMAKTYSAPGGAVT